MPKSIQTRKDKSDGQLKWVQNSKLAIMITINELLESLTVYLHKFTVPVELAVSVRSVLQLSSPSPYLLISSFSGSTHGASLGFLGSRGITLFNWS